MKGKEKEKELERVKKEVAEELYKMIGKYRFNEIEKEAVSIAITSMFKDKQEGREGVIKEIEKLFVPQFDGKKNWLISREEWEGFKKVDKR